jgi:hypothetical protein
MAYIGKQPVVGNFVKLDAITTSATATYNLLNGGVAYFPQTANNCIVSLNGVIQSPTSAYTISGSTIVFSDALTSSDTIDFILVLGDVLSIGTPSDGTITSAKLASGTDGLFAWQSVQTTGFTAVAARAYPCNTTSSAFTVTLPASPSVGDQVLLLDYAGTFATNNITLGRNSNKIEGGTTDKKLTTNREAVTLTYVDSTQGWVASSATNYGTQSIDPLTYSVDFLVVAGGGGNGRDNGSGGAGAGGYRSSNSTYGNSGGGASAESSLTFTSGTVYTITVGAGGTGSTTTFGGNGANSSISGTGISTITSTGGGGGAGSDGDGTHKDGRSGGSGGGAASHITTSGTAGSGTANQGYGGGTAGSDNSTYRSGGGGGGASAVGGNHRTTSGGGHGGNGVASTITGSSVTRGGGGGGGAIVNGTGGNGGSGGGGAGVADNTPPNAGTANTGGGAGGTGSNSTAVNGGSGVVILRMPTSFYSGTTTGSPTVSTSGSDTILVYNSSGSYTG